MRLEYEYRRNDYPHAGDMPLGAHLSRHHVVCYPHMYAFGVILLAYFQLLGDALDSDAPYQKFLRYYGQWSATNDSAVHNIVGNCKNGQRDVLNYYDDKCRNFFKEVAWTESNLFIGPSGTLRADDPGQGIDTVPVSMGQDGFIRRLIELRGRGIPGVIPMSADQAGFISLDVKDISDIARGYIEKLPDVPVLHESRVSDWRAVPLADVGSNRSHEAFEIFFSKNSKNNKHESRGYQLELASNPQFPTNHGRLQRQNGDQVAVLIGIECKRSGEYLTGVLKHSDDSFRQQENVSIAEKIREM